jgi:hypothetical protein
MEQIHKEICIEIQAALTDIRAELHLKSPEQKPTHHSTSHEDLPWTDLINGLPTGPPLHPKSHAKLYKLAKEVHLHAPITKVGRSIYGIQITFHHISHWTTLLTTVQCYIVPLHSNHEGIDSSHVL